MAHDGLQPRRFRRDRFAEEMAAREQRESAADLVLVPRMFVARLAEIEAGLEALRSPFRTAEYFNVEEIIDPRDTRKLLCEFANLAAPLRTPGLASFRMRA